MKIIELDQGTPEWLSWRTNGLGSTDISALVGLNQYKTPTGVYEDKKGMSFPLVQNKFMKAGSDAEPFIRDEYNKYCGTNHAPLCVESLDMPFLRGSLDGYDEETSSILEIKYSMFPKMSKCIKKNDIGHFNDLYPQYNCQCQYFMYLTKAEKCHLATFGTSGELIYMDIPRDEELIKMIVKEATAFWNNNILKNVPPKKVKGDFDNITDAEALALADDLEEIKTSRKALADKDKPLKALEDEKKGLLTEYSEDDFYCKNIKAIKVKKAKLDTKSIAEALDMTEADLKRKYSSYSSYWKLTLEG